jgi:HK97 family phage portal protein
MPVQQILHDQVEGTLEGQNYQNSLYKTGMTAKAVLEYTGDIDSKTREKLRAAFEEFGNGAKNTGRIMPVPLGFKLTPLDVKLTDAQFFELRKYSALQIAAAFGIKPNQINDYEKSSYANSEMQQLSFLVDTELFIIKGYEEEINYKCVSPDLEDKGFFYKFNERAILRTDSKTQTEILTQEVDKAIRSPNEARRKVDLPDKPGGDDLLINGAYVPLQLLIKIAENNAAAAAGAGNGQQSGTAPDTGQQAGKEEETIEKKTFEL